MSRNIRGTVAYPYAPFTTKFGKTQMQLCVQPDDGSQRIYIVPNSHTDLWGRYQKGQPIEIIEDWVNGKPTYRLPEMGNDAPQYNQPVQAPTLSPAVQSLPTEEQKIWEDQKLEYLAKKLIRASEHVENAINQAYQEGRLVTQFSEESLKSFAITVFLGK